MDKFEIKPSSSVTAEISPIILKSGEKIETEFCPKLVENHQDPIEKRAVSYIAGEK